MPERCQGAITVSAQGTRRPRTSETQTQDKAINLNHESSTTLFCPREGIQHLSSSASPFREEIQQETGQREDAQERLNKTLAPSHVQQFLINTSCLKNDWPEEPLDAKKKIND